MDRDPGKNSKSGIRTATQTQTMFVNNRFPHSYHLQVRDARSFFQKSLRTELQKSYECAKKYSRRRNEPFIPVPEVTLRVCPERDYSCNTEQNSIDTRTERTVHVSQKQ